jgi:hypothetical protein
LLIIITTIEHQKTAQRNQSEVRVNLKKLSILWYGSSGEITWNFAKNNPVNEIIHQASIGVKRRDNLLLTKSLIWFLLTEE